MTLWVAWYAVSRSKTLKQWGGSRVWLLQTQNREESSYTFAQSAGILAAVHTVLSLSVLVATTSGETLHMKMAMKIQGQFQALAHIH